MYAIYWYAQMCMDWVPSERFPDTYASTAEALAVIRKQFGRQIHVCGNTVATLGGDYAIMEL